jgi:hypothetical protein
MSHEARSALGWLTPEEAAEILGYTVGSLRTMRSAGKGPKFYQAGKIRYHVDDVDAYIRSNGEIKEAKK